MLIAEQEVEFVLPDIVSLCDPYIVVMFYCRVFVLVSGRSFICCKWTTQTTSQGICYCPSTF